MRALDRKLLRDLWHLRGQALAIALVVASGVATHVVSYSVIDSLRATSAEFYASARLADVFAPLKRAPEALRARLAAIPGVRALETRVTARGLIDVPGFGDPVSALLLSLPGEGGLNRLYLRAGRLPESDREVAINEAFAQAHRLGPGNRLAANINGRHRELLITAVVLSAEFTYVIRPGELWPDHKRYGVLWLPREGLAAAAGMQDAFNDVVLTLAAGASPPAVIAALDRELEAYGGTGAYGRELQTSYRFLADEIRQNENMATIVPLIFLAVAAFLLNVVLSRLLAQERMQVAVLKAFGYGNAAIVAHYVKLSALIVLLGSLLGIAFGARLGWGQSRLYAEFYRFPFMHYVLSPAVALAGVAVSAVAALAGTLTAVLRAAAVPPAQGMRPEEPPRFGRGALDAAWLRRALSPPARMILRNIRRRPLKSALTVFGVALAAAVLVVGGYMWIAVAFMLDVQFGRAHRADVTVTFAEGLGHGVVHELQALPGVRAVEPLRAVPVRLSAGSRSERLALQGLVAGGALQRTLNARYAPVALRGGAVLLTDHLADTLGVAPGDTVRAERLDGPRLARELVVGGTVGELVGHNAYLELGALNDWLGDGDLASGAFLQVDDGALDALNAGLRARPRIVGVMNAHTARAAFNETMGENLLTFALINLGFASTIAVGVVYNSMRTALSERAHELASLRVLGYTRGEVGYVLLGESVLLTLLALPAGLAIGYGFCAWIAAGLASDLFRVPLVADAGTSANACAAVLAAALVSALLMARHIRRLDLVSALKVPQ